MAHQPSGKSSGNPTNETPNSGATQRHGPLGDKQPGSWMTMTSTTVGSDGRLGSLGLTSPASTSRDICWLILASHQARDRKQMVEDRGQRTEDRRQTTEGRGQKTENAASPEGAAGQADDREQGLKDPASP